MDEMGKPLYGDVFGTNAVDFQVRNARPRERSATGTACTFTRVCFHAGQSGGGGGGSHAVGRAGAFRRGVVGGRGRGGERGGETRRDRILHASRQVRWNSLAGTVLTARSLPHAGVLAAWQWADHSRRLLIRTRRHGDPRTDRAEEEENRGGHGRVSASAAPSVKWFFLLDFFCNVCFCFGRNETPQLFTVLPERRTGPVGAAMMASTHIYDMSTVQCPLWRKDGVGGFLCCLFVFLTLGFLLLASGHGQSENRRRTGVARRRGGPGS